MNISSVGELIDFVKKKSDCNIYIWGSGVCGNALGRLFNHNKISWNSYYDNMAMDTGTYLNNKLIYRGDELKREEKAIYILSMRKYIGVKEQLSSQSIPDENIIWFDDFEIFGKIENAVYDANDYSKKIAKFKNLYEGERCFIIGNGPSLKLEDLEKLKNEKTFACNLIFQCFDKTEWRPTNYFNIDANSIRTTFRTREKTLEIFSECENAFVRAASEMWDFRDDPEFSNMYLMNMIFSESEEDFEFSEDCSEKVIMGYTVTYTMMQMAVYMGFKEIYLIGIDHNYSKIVLQDGSIVNGKITKDKEHADFLGNYNLPNGSEVYKVERAYMKARQYAEDHDIKIYNATRGGNLKIFELFNFDLLF